MTSISAANSATTLPPVERWVRWGTLLTAAVILVGLVVAQFVGMRNQPPYESFGHWLKLWLLDGLILLFGYVLLKWFARERSIVARLRRKSPPDRVISVAFGVLCSANLAAFGHLKSELDYLRPFLADPILANIDHAIFGGDPWVLVAPTPYRNGRDLSCVMARMDYRDRVVSPSSPVFTRKGRAHDWVLFDVVDHRPLVHLAFLRWGRSFTKQWVSEIALPA